MTVGELLVVVDEVLYDEVFWVNHDKRKRVQEQHNAAWRADRRLGGRRRGPRPPTEGG